MAKPINICLAQIEVVPGQPQINTETILSAIANAKAKESELIVFPEMAIPGYLLGDMWERVDFLQECEECGKRVIEASEGIAVAFGNVKVDPHRSNEDGRFRKYNTCFVAENGELLDEVVKTLQPNYREFDDNRHFYDRRKLITDHYMECSDDYKKFNTLNDVMDSFYIPVTLRNGLKVGFLLCEDGWDTDYTFSPIDLLLNRSDLVVNISCSPFTMGKNDKRNRVFGKKAKESKTPIVYVNNVGIQNNGKTIYTFDGNSCVYSRDGGQANVYPSFTSASQNFHFDLDADNLGSDWYANLGGYDGIEDLYKSLIYGIDKFLKQIGVDKIVIGLSGGIDSAVVAGLMSRILPPENIYLVNMPSHFNSNTTKDLACEMAENIHGCNYHVVPINESVEVTTKQLKLEGMDLSTFNLENVQARDRSSRILAAIASHVGGVFTCNANKSEMTVGYTTMYGDLGGAIAPLADVWKTDVYRLAGQINKSSNNVIPQGIIDIKPSAELSDAQSVDKGQGDPIIYEYHDKLFASWVERWNRATPADILQWQIDGVLEYELNFGGFNNAILDAFDFDIVEHYFNNDIEAFINDLERWWNLYDGFAYAKRIQAPPVLAVSRRSYGWDLRESQTPPFYSEKYYKLKKEIMDK